MAIKQEGVGEGCLKSSAILVFKKVTLLQSGQINDHPAHDCISSRRWVVVLDTPASQGCLQELAASGNGLGESPSPKCAVCIQHLPSLQHLPGLLLDVCSLYDGLKGVGREKEAERDRDCVCCPLSKA